jgi:hypothetical protein
MKPGFPRTAAAAAAVTLLLAGCSGLPLGPLPGSSTAPPSGSAGTTPAPAAADASPALPTAVQVVTTSSDGIAGFFPFESTSTTATRADMRREDTTLKGTGTVSRLLMPNSATATITRLDRQLVYGLDIPRAEYTECPLGGCPAPASEPRRDPQQPREPQSAREPGCTMKVADNTFNVKPTSQRRAINGFDTEQYAVDWTVTLEDPNRRRSTLQLTIDFWTTATTPAMRDEMAVEASYSRAAVAASQRQAGAAAAALPPQLLETVNRYFAQSMSAPERAALFNVARQMERVKGQPILSQFKLFYRGNACGGAAQEDGGARGGVAGALAGLLGGGGGSSGAAERPLLSFSQEVKSWRVEPVRDSQFVPPPQFKRVNPR